MGFRQNTAPTNKIVARTFISSGLSFPRSLVVSLAALLLGAGLSFTQILEWTQTDVPLPDVGAVDGLQAADLDGDGDIDFVFLDVLASIPESDDSTARIKWSRNNGDGTWTVLDISTFSETNLYNIHLADMDEDGDVDIVSGSGGEGGSNNSNAGAGAALRVHSNDGGGVFTATTILETNLLNQSSPGSQHIRALTAADMDGDLDLDIIMAQAPSYWEGPGTLERVVWIPNNGDGVYGAAQVIRELSGEVPGPFVTGDVDGDGDIDLVVIYGMRFGEDLGDDRGNNEMVCLKNPGNGTGLWETAVIPGSGGETLNSNMSDLQLVDFDQDSDLDVLATRGGDGFVYEGDGTGNFASDIGTPTGLTEIDGFHVVDFDRDGDLDLFDSSSTDRIFRYLETQGEFATEQVFSSAELDGPIGSGSGVFTADINGDDRLDIVTFGDGITWYDVAFVSDPGDGTGSSPANAISLGVLGDQQTIHQFDTLDSSIDTQLALFSPEGSLLEENDDVAGTLQSGFALSLAYGTYYIAVGQFPTPFADGFSATGGPVGGDFVLTVTLNESDVVENRSLTIQDTGATWFSFEIRANEAPSPLGPPVNSVALGVLGDGSSPLQFNTLGSTIDTEIALYNSDGDLLAENDDFMETSQSEVSGVDLEEGRYYVVVGEFDTTFADGFYVDALPSDPSLAANFILNYGTNQSIPGVLPAEDGGGRQWFSFEIREEGRSAIQITSISYNKERNEFTVAWDATIPGPFLIELGTAADLAVITSEVNFLPEVLAAGITESPVTVRVPAALVNEPQLFLRVYEDSQ